MFKVKFNASLTGELGRPYTRPVDITGGTRVSIEEAILDDATTVINCALDVSACVLLAMQCDVDVVVKVNSPSAPDSIFTLAAGVPFIWNSAYGVLKDTADAVCGDDFVTLHVVNAGLVAGTLNLDAIGDPTP